MKLVDSLNAIRDIAAGLDHTVRLMEVCGTHTMAAFRSGLRSLLPPNVMLLSGPGCPVCVTPNRYIDTAVELASQPETMICTFGDMLRVPGSQSSLETVRAQGGMVRVVYSPLDALQAAREQPRRHVIFLGVGFETTAPTVGWTILQADKEKLANYSVLCAHKTMPQAMAALLDDPQLQVDGFICPGHVSIITGARIYEFICRDYHRPCVVAGFEPADLAEAILRLIQQHAEKRADVEIQYRRSVTRAGNQAAQTLLNTVFEPCDEEWRGVGLIPGSGLRIRREFADYDAGQRFSTLQVLPSAEPKGCRCGDVLRGAITPPQCPLFRTRCTPASPIGACMVSSEGTCAAYHRYSDLGAQG